MGHPRHWRALADLKLRPETALFVGLVHASDGVEGARLRSQIVAQYLPRFGVSTECGLGRHSHEQLHAVVETFRTLLSHEASVAAQ